MDAKPRSAAIIRDTIAGLACAWLFLNPGAQGRGIGKILPIFFRFEKPCCVGFC